MCGIAGFIDQPSRVCDPDTVLRKMTSELAHRGPDDEGFYASDGVYLGHRRLAVIDLEGGHQPISNEDSSVVVVANGEIYNYRQLRFDLEEGGHRFSTASDTEVLVHLWEEHGTGMLEHLVGMFAFALWDSRRRTLLLARDRLGQKPLYVHVHHHGLSFGSELRSLMAHPATPAEVDLRALRKYLLYDAVPAPGAMLSGVRKLEPGQWLSWHDGQVDFGRYWDIGCTEVPDLPYDENELGEMLWQRIADSVRLRLIAEVPLGVFLSGGIDSSTVVAAMAEEVSPRTIKTFSVGFDNTSFDETDHARTVARHFGTEHHEEVLSPATVIELLPEILGSMSEPLADGSLVPTFLLSRFARQSVTVALSGDGADEFLLGYPTFQAHRLARLGEWVPGFVGRRVLQPFVSRLPVDTDNISLDFRLKRFVAGLDYPRYERHFVWMAGMGPREQRGLLMPEVVAETRDLDVFEDVVRHRDQAPARDEWDRLGYLYAKLYLQDDILVKVDRASMAHGLEVRCPFLDHRVVELLTALPATMKLRRLTTKYILKKTMRSRLPESILSRPKKGFGMPIAQWLKGPLRDLAEEVLSPAKLRRDGFFDPAGVRALLDQHLAGRADHRKPLWSLIAFQLWRDRYLG
jgi:asparagine synthase (glutamine-hydrolysing)